MKKNLLRRFFATVLLLAITTLTWAYDFEVDGIYYNINSDKTSVTVSYETNYYNSYSGSISIPSIVTYGCTSYNVTSIGYKAFYNCSKLTSVTIPNSVTSIGYGAFSGCSGLTNLIINENFDYDVTSDISTYLGRSFLYVYDKTQNKWYALNDQNEYELYGVYGTDKNSGYEGKLVLVDEHEWEYSHGKWIDLGPAGNSLNYIVKTEGGSDYIDIGLPFSNNIRIQMKFCPIKAGGDRILTDDTGIKGDNKDWRFFFYGSTLYYDFDTSRLSTSKSLNNIYEWEIGNYYIKDIVTNTTILNGAAHTDFSNRDSNMLIHGGGGDLTRYYYVKLFEGETLVRYFVPYYDGATYGLWDKVTGQAYMPSGQGWDGGEIGEYPKCYVNESPINIVSIGDRAFEGCNSLTSVTIPNSVTSIGEGAFAYCSALTSVTIPNSVTSIGQSAFYDCSGLTKAEFASIESLCKIKFGTYYSNPLYYAHHLYIDGQEVTDVVIPNSVTSIGESAFAYCSGLTSVTIPNSVTSIGDDAFYTCSGLTSVIIPNSVTSIGEGAFYGCSGLTSVTIPNSVTSIGEGAFAYCSALTSVTIPNSVTSIGSYAFYGCSGLTSVTIPNSVTSIGQSVFYDCSGLTSMTIPNSVTSIGNYAFFNCSGLTSITIPNSVTSIGYAAFAYCSGLTSVTIPNSVTSIGEGAFAYCSALTSVTIPNSVVSIENSAFSGCSELTSVIIGCNITELGSYAFAFCNKLKDVFCLAEQVPTTQTTAFQYSSHSIATLYVPESALNDYKATAPWSGFGTIVAIEPSYIVGDANGNGEVEIGDVTSVLTLMATPEATGYNNKAADANGNGEIEIGDVTTILTIMAGN